MNLMFWKKKSQSELQPLNLDDLQTYIPVVSGIISKLVTDRLIINWERHGNTDWNNVFYTTKLYLNRNNYVYLMVAKVFEKNDATSELVFLGNYDLVFSYGKIRRNFVSPDFKEVYDAVATMTKSVEAKEKELENAKLYAAILAALKKVSK